MVLSCNLHEEFSSLVCILQKFYWLLNCSVELACRMLQHPGILCDVPAGFKFFLPDGFHLVRNMVSGQADDALTVCQSAGTWSPTRYLRDA